MIEGALSCDTAAVPEKEASKSQWLVGWILAILVYSKNISYLFFTVAFRKSVLKVCFLVGWVGSKIVGNL